MAAGDVRDFVIYDEEFFGGFSEALEQNTNVFNVASQNSIQLRPNRLIGHYEKESFFQSVDGLVSRRDVESISAATDLKLEQDEFIGVKVNRKIGPVKNTIDSFRKIGEDAGTMSFMLGQQIGKAASVEMVNTAIACLAAGIKNLDATAGAGGNGGAKVSVYDGTAGTPTHTTLVEMLALMGDAQGDVVAFAMHSKSYFDLMKQAIADALFEVAGVTVYTGTVATLGRPVIVTDSPSFITTGTPNEYGIMGLTPAACVIDESEGQEVVSDLITGEENLGIRIQGEYAYNAKLKGMKWDTTAGGTNPTDAALATVANWDDVTAVANGIKAGPGVLGRFD